MFNIECPRCETLIGLGLADFFQQRIEKRECPDCGAGLELCNAALFFVFNGLMFGGLMMLLSYWGFHKEWAKVIMVGPLCWVTAPVLVRIIGRWRICPYGVKDAISAGRWARVGSISGWIFGSAVAWTSIIFALHYRDFLLRLDDFAAVGGSDTVENFSYGLKFHVYPGLAVAFVALTVTIVTWVMRMRLRAVDEELYN